MNPDPNANSVVADYPMFWDRIGSAISLETFRQLRADLAYRFLAREDVKGWEVVTAWLGMDQGTSELDGVPPLIFGTVALRRSATGKSQLWKDREWFAAAEDEALANHATVVEQVRAEPDPVS